MFFSYVKPTTSTKQKFWRTPGKWLSNVLNTFFIYRQSAGTFAFTAQPSFTKCLYHTRVNGVDPSHTYIESAIKMSWQVSFHAKLTHGTSFLAWMLFCDTDNCSCSWQPEYALGYILGAKLSCFELIFPTGIYINYCKCAVSNKSFKSYHLWTHLIHNPLYI